MPMPDHLLVIDDDRRLRDLLEKYLSRQGYLVSTVESAQKARHAMEEDTFSLIILDVMMPQESGFDFCKWLRQSSHTQKDVPILMLTACGEPSQRVEGLECGANDYVTKPFEPKELLIRIERILSALKDKDTTYTFGDYTYNTHTQKLLKNQESVFLTSTELSLLDVLIKTPRTPLSRDQLAKHGGVYLTQRTVDVQITRLRRKIEPQPRFPIYIRTIRHQGYAFWPDE